MTSNDILTLLKSQKIDSDLLAIADKALALERLQPEDGIILYEKAELGFVGMIANYVRQQRVGDNVYFNKNIHIEPTNLCIHTCSFCSYAKKKGDPLSWEMSIDEMLAMLKNLPQGTITEVHIVGGVHPERGLDFYCDLLATIKKTRPEIQIKAFTAVEIDFMIKKSRLSVVDTLKELQKAGLETLPGGGAEIFAPEIREKICPTKATGERWLEIHEAAHSIGIPTNATILYGHLESFAQRIDHLHTLRELQDKTKGFQAFIPLKYKKENNDLGVKHEVTWIEDLRNFAISRLYLDNIPNIKAYWPMLGKELSSMALGFGVNDFDGTINDSTKIYSMAGADESNPNMSELEMVALIEKANRKAAERDSLYNIIKLY